MLLAILTRLLLLTKLSDALASPFPVVSPGKGLSVYDEAEPMLYAAKLVYDFADVVKAARKEEFKLNYTESVTEDVIQQFQDESCDFRGLNGNPDGLPFLDVIELLKKNEAGIGKITLTNEEENIREVIGNILRHENEDNNQIFISTFRSIQQKVSCVYGVIKDKRNKRIIVTFRGSKNPDFSTRDWRTNFNAALAEMQTPPLIRDKMKGNLKDRVLVHRGFYNYLFENERIEKQRDDLIRKDIKPLIEDEEEDYSVYVTGHSLGGALATIFSFELAGRNDLNWLPRPVTAITYASPLNGSPGYRTAFEKCEQEGLLRHLRINVAEDVVPTIPPFSLGFTRRALKHVGINLRLNGNKSYSIHHSTNGSFGSAVKNSIFKPVWNALKYHMLPEHYDRLKDNEDDIEKLSIDDLYQDISVVSKDFSEGFKVLS